STIFTARRPDSMLQRRIFTARRPFVRRSNRLRRRSSRLRRFFRWSFQQATSSFRSFSFQQAAAEFRSSFVG
ncbi:hypothetical protein BVRB_017570, partial [Beta vulgaris subsp. vulgaris]